MKFRRKFLVLPAAGAAGDLQPLLALIHRIRERGHDLVVFGNPAVASDVASFNVETVLCSQVLETATPADLRAWGRTFLAHPITTWARHVEGLRSFCEWWRFKY